MDLNQNKGYEKTERLGKGECEDEIKKKNEIICVYNEKDKDGINILHDYKNDF